MIGALGARTCTRRSTVIDYRYSTELNRTRQLQTAVRDLVPNKDRQSCTSSDTTVQLHGAATDCTTVYYLGTAVSKFSTVALVDILQL